MKLPLVFIAITIQAAFAQNGVLVPQPPSGRFPGNNGVENRDPNTRPDAKFPGQTGQPIVQPLPTAADPTLRLRPNRLPTAIPQMNRPMNARPIPSATSAPELQVH